MKDYVTNILSMHDYISMKFNFVDEHAGFSVTPRYKDGEVYYDIDVEDKKLNTAVKLTLKHELGHPIFIILWDKDPELIKRILKKIKRKYIFRFFQKIYYWNPLIRWIKKRAGFSMDITYKAKDEYVKDGDFVVTRADNEYFCDWFAVFGWKQNLSKM